ncbi:LacI family DNA-binding transcriptional regulator [Humibacter antri]
MVTVYDVAERAGVSVGTVSRLLSGRGYVGAASRHRIETAINELNFVPNRAAQSLTTKRTGLVGFLVSDLDNPFVAELAQAVNDRAAAEGHTLVICTANSPEERTRAVDTLRQHSIDGLIVSPPESPELNAKLIDLRRQGLPVVGIGLRLDPPTADVVSTDTKLGAKAAMEHLLELGHRRIAFVADESKSTTTSGRMLGYRESLTSAGIRFHHDYVYKGPLTRATGFRAARAFEQLGQPPTAIFASNDAVALGVLQAAFASAIRVPDELSVVGFDDVDLAQHAVPPLTTVAQPKSEMGRTAADLILQRLRGGAPSAPIERILPCTLVTRSSTGPAA